MSQSNDTVERAVAPLDRRPFVGFLVAVTGVLVLVNVLAKLVYDPLTERNFWTGNFDVNGEGNIPTVWNGWLLLAVALTCVAITAVRGRSGRLTWLAAAVAATLMAADEMLRWHEKLRGVGSQLSGGLGVALPTYAWVLPGAVLAVALLLLVLAWVRRLPRPVRTGVLVGAGMFVLGALGVEAASGWVEGSSGVGLAYNLLTALEEALEMGGCIIVLAALLGLVLVVDDGAGGRLVTVAAVADGVRAGEDTSDTAAS